MIFITKCNVDQNETDGKPNEIFTTSRHNFGWQRGKIKRSIDAKYAKKNRKRKTSKTKYNLKLKSSNFFMSSTFRIYKNVSSTFNLVKQFRFRFCSSLLIWILVWKFHHITAEWSIKHLVANLIRCIDFHGKSLLL